MKRRHFLISAASLLAVPTVIQAQTDTLRVGFDPTYPPFIFQPERGEKYVGFDYDIIRAIARQEKLKLEFVDVPFDQLLEDLESGRIDIAIGGITINDEREKRVNFTHSHFIAGLGVTVNFDDDRIHEFEDFENLRVGVFIGTTGEAYASRLLKSKVFLFNNTEEAYGELRNRAIDAIINDIPINDYFIKYSGRHVFRRLDMTLTKEYLGFATKKGNWELTSRLNRGLHKIQKTGQFTTLYKKWFFKVPPREMIYPENPFAEN